MTSQNKIYVAGHRGMVSSAIVAAVSHAEYTAQPAAMLLALLKPGGVFIDIKSAYMSEAITAARECLWRL